MSATAIAIIVTGLTFSFFYTMSQVKKHPALQWLFLFLGYITSMVAVFSAMKIAKLDGYSDIETVLTSSIYYILIFVFVFLLIYLFIVILTKAVNSLTGD